MSTFLKGMLTLYPGRSYVQNIGLDDSGSHCKKADYYKVDLNQQLKLVKIDIVENIEAKKKIEKFFLSLKGSLFQRFMRKFKRTIL